MTDESDHPYKKYEDSPTWSVLDQAVRDLVDNGDLEEMTGHAYVVGYLVDQLAEAELTRKQSKALSPRT